MKCTDARKYLSAFADGELSTESNLLVLDHLKMCPTCAAKVCELQALRAGLKRIETTASAPLGLRRRIMQSLTGAGTPRVEHRSKRTTSPWAQRVLLPTSLAATIVAAVGFWQWTLQSDRPSRTHFAPMMQVKLASDSLQQHRDCSRMADKHHRRSLGWDRDEIRAQLTAELGFTVLVPDLSAWGYQFSSADTCGIHGRKAAHIIYRSTEDGRLLSLFSCDKILGLNQDASIADCLTATFKSESVSAWSSADASHLLLGPESPAALCQMSLTLR